MLLRTLTAAVCGAIVPAALAAEGKPDIFDGGIGNAVVTLIVFGTVVYILGSKAWPHVVRVINDREQMIRTSLETARHEREQATALLKQYEQQLDKAREQATAIVEDGRRDAESVRQRIQEQARRESDEMIARARREIELATNAAKKEVYDLTADLAVEVAGRIIRKELSAHDHRALVDESLEAIRGSGRTLN